MEQLPEETKFILEDDQSGTMRAEAKVFSLERKRLKKELEAVLSVLEKAEDDKDTPLNIGVKERLETKRDQTITDIIKLLDESIFFGNSIIYSVEVLEGRNRCQWGRANELAAACSNLQTQLTGADARINHLKDVAKKAGASDDDIYKVF